MDDRGEGDEEGDKLKMSSIMCAFSCFVFVQSTHFY